MKVPDFKMCETDLILAYANKMDGESWIDLANRLVINKHYSNDEENYLITLAIRRDNNREHRFNNLQQ